MALSTSLNFKVLTLNCWGLYAPLAKFRKVRIQAIADELSKGEYDIVLLQEIWITRDYVTLCNTLAESLPYAHYFHSGMLGSGLCTFSKFPILETFQHVYSLCGFAHKPQHGDWFGGKVVGLAQLDCRGLRINVYNTHTHAGYGPGAEYAVHKTVEAYELGQFIRLTSDICDGVIIGGDFNAEPDTLAFKLPLTFGNLLDAWTSQHAKYKDEEGMTACFPVWPTPNPDGSDNPVKGARIDYLLYRNNSGYDMRCERCYTTMKRVNNKPYFFSDHLGVAAEFNIKRNITAMAPTVNEDAPKYLQHALETVEKGLIQAKADRIFYAVAFVICLVAIGFCADLSIPYVLNVVISILRTTLMLGLGFCAWMGIMAHCQEITALTAVKKDIGHMQMHGSVMCNSR